MSDDIEVNNDNFQGITTVLAMLHSVLSTVHTVLRNTLPTTLTTIVTNAITSSFSLTGVVITNITKAMIATYNDGIVMPLKSHLDSVLTAHLDSIRGLQRLVPVTESLQASVPEAVEQAAVVTTKMRLTKQLKHAVALPVAPPIVSALSSQSQIGGDVAAEQTPTTPTPTHTTSSSSSSLLGNAANPIYLQVIGSFNLLATVPAASSSIQLFTDFISEFRVKPNGLLSINDIINSLCEVDSQLDFYIFNAFNSLSKPAKLTVTNIGDNDGGSLQVRVSHDSTEDISPTAVLLLVVNQ